MKFFSLLAILLTLGTTSSLRADTSVVFNEIMYHPATNETLFEWVELRNQMAVDVDLSGWSITGGSAFTFASNTIVRGGGFVLVAASPATLTALTGISTNVFGPFTGTNRLGNNGETLRLRNNSGRVVDEVKYGTEGDWPVAPDGSGVSLAKRDPDSASGPAANWTWSAQVGGTPGRTNFPAVPPRGLVFNELSVSTNAGFWLELVNSGTNSQSLNGCVIVHDGATNHEYVFPAGPALAVGAFLAVSNTTLGFHPESGDKLYLLSPSRTNVLDAVVVKKAARGRWPDGTGPYLFPNVGTPGASNSFALRSEIVINEIMYNHRDVPGTNGLPPAASKESWLELYNRSTYSVDLADWELDDGITYRFASQTLAPGGYLVVAKDSAYLRSLYPAITIVGDFSKNLSGRGDTIILRDPVGNPADQVRYFDSGRWPAFASGGGSSLELRDPSADNSKAEAWAASNEAGKASWQTYTYSMTASASVTSGPDGQWRDFVLGLLGDGECWIDDISVVQSPSNAPVQLIANGNFENGLTGWRNVGNHSRSRVENDPDSAGNHVLHLIATGPQEHMHNHLEATLTGGLSVINGALYEISFRARHIAGNNRLNTRLYFNRVARSTELTAAVLNGTPGAQNSRYATNVGPAFAQFQHSPVVPAANAAVTVSVVAQDAQGVTNCQVWWSANGGAWSSAAMTATGGGLYSGSIPGQAASTVVQFYVLAVDGLGAASTFPAAKTNSGALYKVNDGQANLALTHNVRIILTPANTSLLHADTNVMSNELLPCTVIYNESRAYYDVSVHLKSSQRGRNDPGRVGFHLVFQPDDLFRGVHPVMLIDRSNSGRPTCEEILLRHMALQSGVPMTHPDICRVLAPQNAQTGQAIFSPRFEDEFLDTAFENGSDGTLFELELIYYPTSANGAGYKLPQPDNVQGVDFGDLGSNKETYRYNFILKNHRNTDDYSRFITFAKSWSLGGAALEPQTSLTTDWDEWMRSYALVSLMGVGDMYSFGNNHNLMAYQRPSDLRMLYFLWDMDFSFNRGSTSGLVGDQNVGRIVNAVPSIQRLFYGHMLDQVNTVFNTAYMIHWFNRYDDFTLGQDFTSAGGLNYIQQRGDHAKNTINGLGGNAPFAVTGTNFIITGTNLVTLSGTAPVQVKTIWLNGVAWPVTWTSLTGWTLRVPMSAPTNILSLLAYNVRDQPLTNFTKTITVSYTNSSPSAVGKVVFNEIMFNPAWPDAAYVELLNTSPSTAFDLSGWRINGLDYTFPFGSYLTGGQYLVLARSLPTYLAAYPGAPAPFGQFDGALQNDGETLTLTQPGATPAQDVIIDQIRYENTAPWSTNANGTGSSLQLIDPLQDNSRVGNWASSYIPGSFTPGTNIPGMLVPGTTNYSLRFASLTGTIGNPSRLLLYLGEVGEAYLDDLYLASGNVAETGTNYIVNGDFETPLPGAPALTNFFTVVGLYHTNSVISQTNAHSGSNSLRIVSTNSSSFALARLLYKDIPGPTNGQICTFSFWYRPTFNCTNLFARFQSSTIGSSSIPAAILTPPFTPDSSTPPTTIPAVTVVGTAFRTPGANNNLAATLPSFPTLWLNEVQAENLTGPTNSAGQRTAWVELYNPSTNSVTLTNLYLTASYSNLTHWAFPAGAFISPGQFKLIFTDGLTNLSTLSELHTSFSLAPGTGSIALARLDAIVANTNGPGNASESAGTFGQGSSGYQSDVIPAAFNLLASPGTTLTLSGGAPASPPDGGGGTSTSWSTLTDGSFGLVPPSGGGGPGSVAIQNNWTLTYTFPTSQNLGTIDVFSGWGDSGRIWQDYTVSYATAAAPGTFINLATVAFHPGGNSTWVRLTPASVNAKSVRFAFGAQQNGYVGYTELVVQSAGGGGSTTNTLPRVMDYLNYSALPPNYSYGDFPDAQPFYRQSFYQPTPRGTNRNLAAPLVIHLNEWMAANTHTLLNTANGNKYDDWFELYNPGDAPAQLGGYYLTDNLANPLQFQIPEGISISAHGFLLVWADGEPGLNHTNQPDLHVSFKLMQAGEAIALYSPNGTLIDALTFTQQLPDVTQGRFPDGPGASYFLLSPTPRATNSPPLNRAPLLNPISSGVAFVGLPYKFIASATDPDLPPQTLTYSLDLGAPAGATLDSSTGQFLWTPTSLQFPSTNTLTLRATDNGPLTLNASRTFQLVVRMPLLLGGLSHAPNGDLSFTLAVTVGRSYRVEYKNDLNDLLWTELTPAQQALTSTITVIDHISAHPQRFYRVLQLD